MASASATTSGGACVGSGMSPTKGSARITAGTRDGVCLVTPKVTSRLTGNSASSPPWRRFTPPRAEMYRQALRDLFGASATGTEARRLMATAVERACGQPDSPTELAPCLLRHTAEFGQRWPTLANGKCPGQRGNERRIPRRRSCTAKITQIYEGTNQIQRMVMARQLLKG